MKKNIIQLILFLIIFTAPGHAWSYKTDTHWLITQEAANVSSKYSSFLNEYKLNSLSSASMMGLGAIREDDLTLPVPRFVHHFYDPIYEVGLLGRANALIWGYAYESTIDKNEFSWRNAREYMFEFLTAENELERYEYSNLLFRSLGQIIHLEEDMAQPSHTRNDPHASHYEPYGDYLAPTIHPSHLEDWAQFHPSEVIAISNMAAGPKSVFSYDDAFESMALFSNENFFSDDTIFDDYDLPSKDQTNYTDDFIPRGIGEVAHVLAEDGETYEVPYIVMEIGPYTGYKLAQVGYFGARIHNLPIHDLAFQIDDQVARENAQILIPWAVGYSAGLLDYFFRGDLEAEADGSDGVKIKNNSNENMNGVFALYYDAVDGQRYPVEGAAWPFGLDAGEESPRLEYTEPTDPAPKESDRYLLVFKGTMGQEESAVVGTFVELSSDPLLYVGIYSSGSLIYWDIKNDRQVDLEDVNLISTPLVTPTSQTYSSGILSDNCTRTRLMNHLWDGNCGSEATGPNAEKVFIVGVNEPIGTYEYKLTATGHWDGTNFNYFHKIDQDRTNTFYGFRIIRDIWQIVIGITYSGGGTSEISESYWQTPAGFIQDHVVSSLTTNMYDSRFGIYTSTVGILDDRVEDPIGMFESIRVSPGGTTITGTYFEPDRGAITKADFDPIKTWIMTVSHETDTPPGPYESYYIRIDRFDNSDFAYIHDNTIILPNLADFWLSKGNLTLYGLYTGHVLGE